MKRINILLKRIALLGTATVLQVFWPLISPAQAESYEGRAFAPSSGGEAGALVYIEKHEAIFQNGRIQGAKTRYFSPEDELIGTLDSDFRDNPYVGSYTFTDLRAFRKGHQEGVRTLGKEVEIFFAGKTAKIPLAPDLVAGQGFHYKARDLLDRLEDDQAEDVRMIIPSRLDDFKFRIAHRHSLPEQPSLTFLRLEVRNWLLRLFAPHLDVLYDPGKKRLMRYTGISNLPKPNGDVQKVLITYRYD